MLAQARQAVDRLWKSCVKLPRSDFVSREALALDISRVVSRVVSGEPIDTAERGAALAAKYPELGMNAELIGQAIDRAAGMVGLIKTAPLRSKAAVRAAPSLSPQPRGRRRDRAAELRLSLPPRSSPFHRWRSASTTSSRRRSTRRSAISSRPATRYRCACRGRVRTRRSVGRDGSGSVDR